MASVVGDTLRLTFKLLLSKIRDKGAENLKHGDDGVSLMYQSFAKSGNGSPSIQSEVYSDAFDNISLMNTDVTNIELDEWEVLHLMSDGLQFDKIDCEDKFFVEAKDFFKKAAESATKAFSNEALDIYDRVLAMKFRAAATMLHYISEPEVAVVLCKNYIEQLNGLPEVLEAFSVRFGRFNMRKLFCEMRREAVIGAVVSINRILWEYLHLSSKGDDVLRNWPVIPADSRYKIHPVQNWEVCRGYFWKFGEFGSGPAQLNGPVDVATNSSGSFIIADRYNFQVKVFSKDGNLSQRMCELAFLQTFNEDLVDTNLIHPQSIDVDKLDRVYICSSYKSALSGQYINEVISTDHQGEFLWSFGRGVSNFNQGKLTSIAVDKNRERVFTLCQKTVFVLTTGGTFLSSFTLTGEFTQAKESHLCVTTAGNLIITANNGMFCVSKRAANDISFRSRTVHPTRFNMPHRKIPNLFNPSGITFNPHTEEISVVDRASNSLIMFDTRGNFIRKVFFYEKYSSGGATVTRDGHVAIASKSSNKIFIV
ncbi:B-box type zinc finger protein ncl-1 [Stylophora pistillata]|uniref:B-box type zinc finger protein ncl-1 n=1 Tax=Stylophora pistillata TaxID=50429 RepID=A0A2B4SEU4_STYPI|nr:B-box type zinc finger protein ncl-1 [Stylophora pistillata]